MFRVQSTGLKWLHYELSSENKVVDGIQPFKNTKNMHNLMVLLNKHKDCPYSTDVNVGANLKHILLCFPATGM